MNIKRYNMKVVPGLNPLMKVSAYGISDGKYCEFDDIEKLLRDETCDLRDQLTKATLTADEWKDKALLNNKLANDLGKLLNDVDHEICDYMRHDAEWVKKFRAALAAWGESEDLKA